MLESQQVQLRKTELRDLETLFGFQQNAEATHLAAFTARDGADKEAYVSRYAGFLGDATIHMQTILLDGVVVGSVAKFLLEEKAEITYWIDRRHWGGGIATAALRLFLALESTRPLYGRVAFDNLGSQRVLAKCGFVKIGADTGFANARQAVITEFIYELR